MNISDQDQVLAAADAISRYLNKRPNASETVDGVAKWWLMRQRFDDSMDLVQKALDYLEAQGDVTKVPIQGGRVIYRKRLLN